MKVSKIRFFFLPCSRQEPKSQTWKSCFFCSGVCAFVQLGNLVVFKYSEFLHFMVSLSCPPGDLGFKAFPALLLALGCE